MVAAVQQLDVEVGYQKEDGTCGDPFRLQRIVMHSRWDKEYVYAVGGYSSGKTTTLVQYAHLGMIENPGMKGLIVTPTFDDFRATVQPGIQAIFDAYEWGTGIQVGEISVNKMIIETVWGSKVFLRSMTRPERIFGWEVDWVVMDEGEVAGDPMYVWTRCDERKREKPRPPGAIRRWSSFLTVATVNPQSRGTTVLRHFRERVGAGDPDYRIVRIPTAQNPSVPAKYLRSRKTQLSDRLYKLLVECDLDVLSQEGPRWGQAFNPNYHDPDRPKSPSSGNKIKWRYRSDLDYVVAMDPGLRPHGLLIQIDREGIYTGVEKSVVVFDEVYGERWSDDYFLEQVALLLIRRRIGLPKKIIIDPHGGVSAQFTQKCRAAFPWDKRTKRPFIHSALPANDSRDVREDLLEIMLKRGDGLRRVFFADSLDWSMDLDPRHGKRPVVWSVAQGVPWKKTRRGEILLVTQKEGYAEHSAEALMYVLETEFPFEAQYVAQQVGVRVHSHLYGPRPDAGRRYAGGPAGGAG